MLNHIVLMGRLTRDPELRHTGNGTAVASFSLAVDRDYKGQSGEKETDFVDIAALQQEIEKLRGQNEQLREAAALVTKESAELLERRWIPVTERLPEDRSDVLVVAYWHERWGVYMGWCAPERVAWSVHIGIGDRSDIAVTHWMPLPEPLEMK